MMSRHVGSYALLLALIALSGCDGYIRFRYMGAGSETPPVEDPAPAPLVDKVAEAMRAHDEFRSCLSAQPTVSNVFKMKDDNTLDISRLTMSQSGCLGKIDFADRRTYDVQFVRLEENLSRVELTLKEVHITSGLQPTVNAYNTTFYCGKNNWNATVEQDCTDANASFQSGQKLYYTLRLSNAGHLTTQELGAILEATVPTDYSHELKTFDTDNVVAALKTAGPVSYCQLYNGLKSFSIDAQGRLLVGQTDYAGSTCVGTPIQKVTYVHEIKKQEHQSGVQTILELKLVDLGITFYDTGAIGYLNSSPNPAYCNITDWQIGVERFCSILLPAYRYLPDYYLTLKTDGTSFYSNLSMPSEFISSRANTVNSGWPFVSL